jgi:hypothetical protein
LSIGYKSKNIRKTSDFEEGFWVKKAGVLAVSAGGIWI